jgi:prepilin-type N-terminal cleavage/methylation domain-containing protein
MDRLRLRAEGGFTLIELLVVIAIIGILAAIAIPQFAAYRRRGYDSQVKSDLRNAATAQEAYFGDKNTYSSDYTELLGTRGYRQSDNVTIATSGTAGGFTVTGTAKAGCAASSGTWTFNSGTGQITGTACN